MIEGEMAFTNHAESLEIQEQYVTHVVKSVLENCKLELKILERDTSNVKLRHHSLEFHMMMVEFLSRRL